MRMTPIECSVPVFDISQVSEELTPEAKAILDTLKEKVCYILEYPNIKKYDEAIEALSNNMLYGFEHSEFRDFPVQYKFRKDDPTEEFKFLPYRHFIINMIMWRPQFCLDKAGFNDSLIIDGVDMTKFSPTIVKKYFDKHYVNIYNRNIPDMPYLGIDEINGTLSEILGDTTFLIQTTTSKFSNFFGLSADIETFIKLAESNPRINELLHFKLDESKQPAEMEREVGEAMNEFTNLVIKEDFNKLTPLLAIKSGLNVKQVRDMVINSCLKPDFNGRTFPHPVNTNFLAGGGLKDLIHMYTVAITGRKAAIINNEFMGKTGHMLILVAINTSDVKLSKTTMDCNTVNPIPIFISSKDHLQKMNGRRYRFRGDKEYHILNSETDVNLIGQTLEFRSPITCACKDGVCRECYGDLYYSNVDLESPGAYSAIIVMNPVVQGILSAKHHQATNTAPIIFNEEFNDYFSLYSTDVTLAVDSDLDTSDYSILIYREDIGVTDDDDEELESRFKTTKKKRRKKATKSSDDDDEDASMVGEDDEESSAQAMKYFVTRFFVVKNLHSKTEEPVYIEIKDQDGKEMFMHTDFIDRMYNDSNSTDQYLYIDFEDINVDECIFTIDVENNEVTKPMKSIQRLLNNKDHENCPDIPSITNKMLDLIIASHLSADGVHAEMIIRNLVRRSYNTLKRPDFNKIIMTKDYEIMTINSALKRNPAITTSLSTPYLKYQLVNLVETFEKDAQSVFDPFFKTTLSDNTFVSEMNKNTR